MKSSWRCRRPGSSAVGPQCGGSTNDTTSASKKTLYAEEQRRADIVRARRRWMREQGMFDPARLVFIDETCTNTAMVRQRGMTAPFVIEGAMNGPMFLAYVRQCLVPTLKRGETVLMDNLPVHKVAGVAEAIQAAGAMLIYLPKYSPGLQQTQGASAQGGRAYHSASL